MLDVLKILLMHNLTNSEVNKTLVSDTRSSAVSFKHEGISATYLSSFTPKITRPFLFLLLLELLYHGLVRSVGEGCLLGSRLWVE